MDVMIAVPFVLPEQAVALGGLEARVEERGRRVMRQGLAAAWAAQPALRPEGTCPACGARAAPRGARPASLKRSSAG